MARKAKKRIGRPATGQGTPIMVRVQDRLLKALDDWIARQSQPMSRPEALRKLAAMQLLGNGS
jgi:hypothetical protein